MCTNHVRSACQKASNAKRTNLGQRLFGIGKVPVRHAGRGTATRSSVPRHTDAQAGGPRQRKLGKLRRAGETKEAAAFTQAIPGTFCTYSKGPESLILSVFHSSRELEPFSRTSPGVPSAGAAGAADQSHETRGILQSRRRLRPTICARAISGQVGTRRHVSRCRLGRIQPVDEPFELQSWLKRRTQRTRVSSTSRTGIASDAQACRRCAQGRNQRTKLSREPIST